MTSPAAIDTLLDELAEILARMARLRSIGVRPVSVRAAALDVIEEIVAVMDEGEVHG